MNEQNLLLMVDSYKHSHYALFPEGTEELFGYGESRKKEGQVIIPDSDKIVIPYALFVGINGLVRDLQRGITEEDVEEAKAITEAHGIPFNYKAWKEIAANGGKLPLEIRSVREGSIIPRGNAVYTVKSTDKDYAWMVPFFETIILRAIWYPTTVATLSHYIKHEMLKKYLEETSDDLSNLEFMLHDFGARGVSSEESARIGGAAHLVNFRGTDNLAAIFYIKKLYNEGPEYMPARSIPATEHSTMTTWGSEKEAVGNAIEKYLLEGKTLSIVGDSYDIYNFVEKIIGGEQFREKIINSGGKLIVRPDSGNPNEVIPRILNLLGEKFGKTQNKLRYNVLPDYIRVIQGDGINFNSIGPLYESVKKSGWAPSNLSLGSGGGLLQNVNRDFLDFSSKVSAIKRKGKWYDVFKDPSTDPNKRSKRGPLGLFRNNGYYETLRLNESNADDNLLIPYFRDGKILRRDFFEDVRARANYSFSEKQAA